MEEVEALLKVAKSLGKEEGTLGGRWPAKWPPGRTGSQIFKRERSHILRNPQAATCDWGTFRPARGLENEETTEKETEYKLLIKQYH